MLIRRLLPGNEKGIVLPIGLLLIGALAIVGVTAVVVTTVDIRIGQNYQSGGLAFHDAESGVNYAMGCMQNALDAGTLALPEEIGGTVSLSSCTTPTGFNFSLSDVTKTEANRYTFISTGRSPTGGGSRIEASFRKGMAIEYGAFGDTLVDMKSNSKVYSYNSGGLVGSANEDALDASDSTGEGDVGSNADVAVDNGSIVDGDVGLGDDGSDPATEATYTPTGSPYVTGTAGADVDRVEPDPLGIVGGDYAQYMADAAAAGNPDSLCGDEYGVIDCGYGDDDDDDDVVLGDDDDDDDYGVVTQTCSTCTTPTALTESGLRVLEAGDYYFTDITLNNGAELIIDCSAGDVNIYLDGGLEAKNGSTITVVNGHAADFGIFSNSNTDNLIFKHGSHFQGVVYAPYTTVEMKNSGNFYGAIWADTVDLKNSAEVWFDTALKDKYLWDEVEIAAWFEIID